MTKDAAACSGCACLQCRGAWSGGALICRSTILSCRDLEATKECLGQARAGMEEGGKGMCKKLWDDTVCKASGCSGEGFPWMVGIMVLPCKMDAFHFDAMLELSCSSLAYTPATLEWQHACSC